MRQTVTKTSEGQMGLGNALRWVWKMEDLGLGSVLAELGLSIPRGASSSGDISLNSAAYSGCFQLHAHHHNNVL